MKLLTIQRLERKLLESANITDKAATRKWINFEVKTLREKSFEETVRLVDQKFEEEQEKNVSSEAEVLTRRAFLLMLHFQIRHLDAIKNDPVPVKILTPRRSIEVTEPPQQQLTGSLQLEEIFDWHKNEVPRWLMPSAPSPTRETQNREQIKENKLKTVLALIGFIFFGICFYIVNVLSYEEGVWGSLITALLVALPLAFCFGVLSIGSLYKAYTAHRASSQLQQVLSRQV